MSKKTTTKTSARKAAEDLFKGHVPKTKYTALLDRKQYLPAREFIVTLLELNKDLLERIEQGEADPSEQVMSIERICEEAIKKYKLGISTRAVRIWIQKRHDALFKLTTGR